jgi:hypothetical protein
MQQKMQTLMHWQRAEKLEAIIHSWDAHNLSNQMDQAAAALNLPAWDADVHYFQVVSVVVLHCVVCFI